MVFSKVVRHEQQFGVGALELPDGLARELLRTDGIDAPYDLGPGCSGDPRQQAQSLFVGVRGCIEAGSRLAGAFLRGGWVDELILYLAPSLLGPQARALAELPAIVDLAQRWAGQFTDCTRLGDDLRLTVRPRERGAVTAPRA